MKNSDNGFWLFIIVFSALLLGGVMLENHIDATVIKSCVEQGREPVIEGGQLKECKQLKIERLMSDSGGA